jgi:dephospho-CoA kinase
VYLIGLTGGIAAGKSTVAKQLVERGAVHIDADLLAREVVEPGTPGLAAVREAFGEGVFAPDGTLDRAALGAIVFTDADSRIRLEEILHPLIRELAGQSLREAEENDPNVIVVYDIPLLIESKNALRFDQVVVCVAPAEQRVERLMEFRGLSREEAERRVALQASDSERLAVADLVIDTSGTLEYTREQALDLWRSLSADS